MAKKTNKLDLTQFEFMYDTLLVKAVREEKVGELYRPEQYEDKPEFGEVIKTGQGKLLEDGTVLPMPFKAGDLVFFGKYLSEQTRVLGDDYYLIKAEDVRAVRRG